MATSLNAQQSKIVDLPLSESALVLAGAGSGKTTVVASRAVRLVDQLPPDANLQLLTFANKAAKEMKDRVKRIGCNDIARINFDTFHSFGLKLIKDDPLGYKLVEGFTLLNESDVKRSIRAYAKSYGLAKDLSGADRRRLDPMAWQNTWSLARQAGFDVNNPRNKEALLGQLVSAHSLVGSEPAMAWMTMVSYERSKAASNSVDFDDLIYLPLLRLAREDEYRSRVQASIGYVLVDEVQDTNRIQYELIRYSALGHCGVTCVGDDDQSIYGWRGAEVSNLRRFLSQFNAVELRLERNYRSTRSIVDTSVQLITNNQNRLPKTPYSEGENGVPPAFSSFEDHWRMADELATSIAQQIAEGVTPSEIAVLYRTNRMAMLLEQSLRRAGIPYHVVGGMSLFDRSEVVAVTSVLRVAVNPRDTQALKNLVDYIDGLGQASVYAVCDWLDEMQERSLLALPGDIPGISEKRLAALVDFYGTVLDEALMSSNAEEFVTWVIEGPMALLDREKDDQLRQRKEMHLKSLVRDIQGELSERTQVEPRLSWRDVMVEVALRDARQSEGESGQITLSTIHRSKGLEWPYVYIAGASEGLMPLDSRTELNSEDAAFSHVEEERRLAFVALTRAKSMCWLYHAEKYAFPGSNDEKTYEPSRFISEMGISLKPSLKNELNEKGAGETEFDVSRFKNDFAKLCGGL